MNGTVPILKGHPRTKSIRDTLHWPITGMTVEVNILNAKLVSALDNVPHQGCTDAAPPPRQLDRECGFCLLTPYGEERP